MQNSITSMGFQRRLRLGKLLFGIAVTEVLLLAGGLWLSTKRYEAATFSAATGQVTQIIKLTHGSQNVYVRFQVHQGLVPTAFNFIQEINFLQTYTEGETVPVLPRGSRARRRLIR